MAARTAAAPQTSTIAASASSPAPRRARAKAPAAAPDLASLPAPLRELLQLLQDAEAASGHRNPVDRAVCLVLGLATGRRVQCGQRLGDALRAHVVSWARRAEDERAASKAGRVVTVDERTVNLARLGLAEGQRTGIFPADYTLERLLADGAHERAALLAHAALGFDLDTIAPRADRPAREDDDGHLLLSH